jgi:hypothetical protein
MFQLVLLWLGDGIRIICIVMWQVMCIIMMLVKIDGIKSITTVCFVWIPFLKFILAEFTTIIHQSEKFGDFGIVTLTKHHWNDGILSFQECRRIGACVNSAPCWPLVPCGALALPVKSTWGNFKSFDVELVKSSREESATSSVLLAQFPRFFYCIWLTLNPLANRSLLKSNSNFRYSTFWNKPKS